MKCLTRSVSWRELNLSGDKNEKFPPEIVIFPLFLLPLSQQILEFLRFAKSSVFEDPSQVSVFWPIRPDFVCLAWKKKFTLRIPIEWNTKITMKIHYFKIENILAKIHPKFSQEKNEELKRYFLHIWFFDSGRHISERMVILKRISSNSVMTGIFLRPQIVWSNLSKTFSVSQI